VLLAIAVVVLVGAALEPPPASRVDVAAALASGDAHYEKRAEGAHGGTAHPAQVDAAIADYRWALSRDPSSYPARLGLLRAMFFRGGFSDMSAPDQIKLFDDAKRLADETVRRLEGDLKDTRLRAHRESLRREPLAAEIYLWAAVSWGQWATTHKLAAAWQGAAGQIRDLAQAVIDIEPRTMFGAGLLILGRLHAEAPRIPMVTPWVSREKALLNLRRAVEIAPESSSNIYFLAEAILALQPASRAEAQALLERCRTAPPRPGFLVEDTHYAEEAEVLLEALRPVVARKR